MKQKGKEIKAKKKSHTPSASSAPPTSKKQSHPAASSASLAMSTAKKQRYHRAASSAPWMLLTRAGAAKKLQEAVTHIDNSSSIMMTPTASLAPLMLTAKNPSQPSTAASLAPSMIIISKNLFAFASDTWSLSQPLTSIQSIVDVIQSRLTDNVK
jgi:hypothetical protein